MKKTLKALLAALAITLSCGTAVSCAGNDEPAPDNPSSSPEHTHTASGEWQKNATQHWKICADDNEKVEVENHTFGEWVTDKAPTKLEKGSKHRECSVCGYRETEEIDKLEHTHTASGEWQKNATQHWKICADDNEKVEVENHAFGEWVTDETPTCTEKGSKHKTCSVCGYEDTEEIAELGHDYQYTDNGDGTHTGVCSHDATHKIENEAHSVGTEYAGHDAEKHWKICSVCGGREEGAHDFKFKVDAYECECGEVLSVTARDLYKNAANGTTFEVDLGVENVNVPVEEQQTKAGSYPIALGEDYAAGELSSIKFGKFDIEGATLSNGVLTLPADAFSAQDAGEQSIVCMVKCGNNAYKLTLHLTVATRVIHSVEEWSTVLRDPISKNDKERSGVYGYFTIAGDLDFEHEPLRDPAFPEGADTSSLGKKSGYIDGKTGFVGTFNGRGYSLLNFNTENPFGLFLITNDANAVKSTIENLVVEQVWHDNGIIRANIFGHSIAGVTFDNITINVAKTSLTGTAVTPDSDTLNGRGFICGAYANKNTYKDFTVNASGHTISSLFGWWIKRSGAAGENDKIITCDNMVVNARNITYWGRLDGEGDPALTPEEYPMAGLTYNQDEINEIDITNNGQRFVVNLQVEDTTKVVAEQTIGAMGNAEIALGKDYGTLVGVKYNGDIIGNAAVTDNVLSIPVNAFGAGAIGEREVEVEMQDGSTVNILSVKLLVATKAISTAEEFTRNITDQTATYGYFVLANDIDFNNKALSLPGWFDNSHGPAWNDNTIDGSSIFFAGTFDGMGYKIKNYNTGSANDGGRYGLFGKIRNATVKNVVIEDVVYTGDQFVGIFAFMATGSRFENITINVKSSALPADGMNITNGVYGFIFGKKLQKSSFKDIVVNAQGQEIYSLFAYWIMRVPTSVKDGNYVTCENVVINAKKVHYWGRIDTETIGDAEKEAPMDVDNYPINEVRINTDSQEA